jgi:hypothetical protein
MKLGKSTLPLLNFILAAVFITPLIYTSRFIFLSADDYCRASSSLLFFSENIQNWYLYHNGRFINAVFSYMPLYNLSVLRTIAAAMFILLGIVLYSFNGVVLKIYKVRCDKKRQLFLSLILYILILAQLPSVYEFFYWYATITAYLLSFLFFIFFMQFALKSYYDKKYNPIIIALVIILINGNNEILLGLTNFLLIALLAYRFFKDKKWDIYLVVLNIISWISSLIVVLSPGSLERQTQYEYGGNLIGSIKVAFIYGGKYFVESFFELPFMLFYLFVFLFVYNKLKDPIKDPINPILLLLVSYLSIISLSFIVFYATGLLDIRTGRIGNMVKLVTLVFLYINAINFAIFIKQSEDKLGNTQLMSRIVVAVLLIFIVSANKNYRDLYKDYKYGNLENYAINMELREQKIKSSKNSKILLTRVEGTLILKSDDNNLISEEWMRSCYKAYFNEKYNLNIERVELEEITTTN